LDVIFTPIALMPNTPQNLFIVTWYDHHVISVWNANIYMDGSTVPFLVRVNRCEGVARYQNPVL